MSTTVYGASDDLIEMEGDITGEFYIDCDRTTLLAFSDGTVLAVRMDEEGVWRFTPRDKGTAKLDIAHAVGADEDGTDRVTLTGDVRWCLLGTEMRRAG